MCRNAPAGGLAAIRPAGAGARAWFLMAGLVTLLSGVGPRALGHENLGCQIQHLARMEAGATNLDLTLELVFHETASLAERRRMDRNRDGRITREELRQYARELAPDLERGLGLSVDGRQADLVMLHDPRIDLRDVEVVVPSPHVLTVRMFARTPPHFREGSRLRIRDGLWPAIPGVHVVEGRGRDGVRIEEGGRGTSRTEAEPFLPDSERDTGGRSSSAGEGRAPSPRSSAGGAVFNLRWVPTLAGSGRESGQSSRLSP